LKLRITEKRLHRKYLVSRTSKVWGRQLRLKLGRIKTKYADALWLRCFVNMLLIKTDFVMNT
jgi:hypothetical protein